MITIIHYLLYTLSVLICSITAISLPTFSSDEQLSAAPGAVLCQQRKGPICGLKGRRDTNYPFNSAREHQDITCNTRA